MSESTFSRGARSASYIMSFNSFGAKFQTTLVVGFFFFFFFFVFFLVFFLTNCRLERRLYVKLTD